MFFCVCDVVCLICLCFEFVKLLYDVCVVGCVFVVCNSLIN
jgi:hypothetical protein